METNAVPATRPGPERALDPAAAPPADPVGGLSGALDRIGFTRAHAGVLALVLAGMFFDALEQDATGAIGAGLGASFGVPCSTALAG